MSAGSAEGDGTGTQTSSALPKPSKFTLLEDHLNHQRDYFSDMSSYFTSDKCKQVEADVANVLRHICQRGLTQMKESFQAGQKRQGQQKGEDELQDQDEAAPDNGVFRVLDVGCGTGVLFPFLLEAANELDLKLEITGVDLCEDMISKAKEHANFVLQDEKGGSDAKHSFSFFTKDFCEMILGDQISSSGDGLETEQTLQHRGKYDAVFVNSCFANFFNTDAVLMAMIQSLKFDGTMFVTHPLGSEFVRGLNRKDPDTVPHHLPTKIEWHNLLQQLPAMVLDFVDEPIDFPSSQTGVASTTSSFPVYLASAVRCYHRCLPQVIRLRGPVAEGYGRGGKKLGFPTANLPASLFADALQNVAPGVYFGWALIEDKDEPVSKKNGRNVNHKAVVNVGYSPTFEGQENKEKIVEAHLILPPSPSTDQQNEQEQETNDNKFLTDFYHETMRLSLIGFLRPEMKFDSFPALVGQITTDVKAADYALSLEPFEALITSDLFLSDPSTAWTGMDGGDEKASWEFADMKEAIKATGINNMDE